MITLERHESYRAGGRTTRKIEWRVWNNDHTSYTAFKTKREALAYANCTPSITPARKVNESEEV